MNLKSFTRSNTPPLGKARISIYPRGTIILNRITVNETGLKEGDKIEFHQSREKGGEKEWFFSKTRSDEGFFLGNNSGSLKINCRGLAQRILHSIEKDGETVKLMVSTEPINDKYYTIITSSIKIKTNG